MPKPIKRRRGSPPLPQQTAFGRDAAIASMAERMRKMPRDSTYIFSRNYIGSGTPRSDVPLALRLAMYGRARVEMTKEDVLAHMIHGHRTRYPASVINNAEVIIRSRLIDELGAELAEQVAPGVGGSCWLPKHCRDVPLVGLSEQTEWALDHHDALFVAEQIQPSDPRKDEHEGRDE